MSITWPVVVLAIDHRDSLRAAAAVGRTIWDAALVGDERASVVALRDVCVPLFDRAARIPRAARPAGPPRR